MQMKSTYFNNKTVCTLLVKLFIRKNSHGNVFINFFLLILCWIRICILIFLRIFFFQREAFNNTVERIFHIKNKQTNKKIDAIDEPDYFNIKQSNPYEYHVVFIC